VSDVSAAEAALKEALQPVIELDSKLALQEAHVVGELEQIRVERRKLASVLRALDPERAPSRPGPKPGGGSRQAGVRTAPYSVAEGVVEEVRLAILGFNGEQFNANDVLGRIGENGESRANRKDKVNKAIARLRERGQVRLVSARGGRHGGSVYVATPRIEAGALSEASNNGSA